MSAESGGLESSRMQSNMADNLHGELSDGTGASREIEAELRIHSNQGTAAMAGTRGYGDERAEDMGARHRNKQGKQRRERRREGAGDWHTAGRGSGHGENKGKLPWEQGSSQPAQGARRTGTSSAGRRTWGKSHGEQRAG